jgi:hypothetical protein
MANIVLVITLVADLVHLAHHLSIHGWAASVVVELGRVDACMGCEFVMVTAAPEIKHPARSKRSFQTQWMSLDPPPPPPLQWEMWSSGRQGLDGIREALIIPYFAQLAKFHRPKSWQANE